MWDTCFEKSEVLNGFINDSKTKNREGFLLWRREESHLCYQGRSLNRRGWHGVHHGIIPPLLQCLSAKLDWLVTYFKWLPPVKLLSFSLVVLQDHVENWNHYIFTTTVLVTTKLDRLLTYLEGFLSMESHDPLITWSCDKLKVYLYYHNNYGNQTWQGGDIPWGAPFHKATSSFHHAVLQDNMASQVLYIHFH